MLCRGYGDSAVGFAGAAVLQLWELDQWGVGCIYVSYLNVRALGVELWGLQGHERFSCRIARVLQVQLWALLSL